MNSHKIEVIKSLENVVDNVIVNNMLKPDNAWQPTDFLPDLTSEIYAEEIASLRYRCQELPDLVFDVLIGNMITEEALPSYQTFFNLLEGVNDEGVVSSNNPWVKWSRAWTAEENRHGDLLNKYLFLSGRVDMRKVEIYIHSLLYNGFNPKSDKDLYKGIIYTSFQERATKIAHVNTGKAADKFGDETLSKICKIIAGDEARHEKSYKIFMQNIFEKDPNEAIISYAEMMKKGIEMPARLMNKNEIDEFYEKYSVKAQNAFIYTSLDYLSIIEHLNSFWKIESILNLNENGTKAQDYLCNLPKRYMKLVERKQATVKETNKLWLL
jgi:acyl-[acyl-carrier-protein] desaturase